MVEEWPNLDGSLQLWWWKRSWTVEVSSLEHQAKKEAGRVLLQRVSRRVLRERQRERTETQTRKV